jgi:hypothetical protein
LLIDLADISANDAISGTSDEAQWPEAKPGQAIKPSNRNLLAGA